MDTESAIHAACALLEQGEATQALLYCDSHQAQNPLRTPEQEARWELIRSWSLAALGQLDEALSHAVLALKRDPCNAHIHLQHAHVLAQQGQDDLSLLALRRCLALAPHLAQAHFDLGAALHRRGHYQEAWQHYQAAFQCGLTPPRAHFSSFAQAADYAGDTAAAEYFGAPLRTLSDGRDDPYQLWLEGFRAFKQGHFEQAWALYDQRHHHPHIAQSHAFPLPYWDGVCHAGQTLLVHGEQGLGDEIMFAGSLPHLLAHTDAAGMQVVLAVKPGLCRLFAHNFPQCLVVPHHHTQGLIAQWPDSLHMAAHIPLANLPSLFLKTKADFERNAHPYLTAPPESAAYFGNLLDALIPQRRQKLLVGLVWACAQGKNAELDARAIPAAQLAALGGIEGLAFVSLHNQDHAGEAALAPTLNILDLGLWQQDFCDTAGLIHHMDLVIGVDTATSHLAGAMGARVLQPLLKYADWRRQTPGDPCIWYRNTQYVRQSTMFSWFDVLAAVRKHLEQDALSLPAHAKAERAPPQAWMQPQIEALKADLKDQLSEKWQGIDRIEDLMPPQPFLQCALCGHQAPSQHFSPVRTDCIFGGGRLLRHVCPACDAIFGPQKMLQLSPQALAHDYNLHYKVFQEGDSTGSEVRAFFALNPKREGVYVNYGAGGWSKSVAYLRSQGWNVWAYEPHGSAVDADNTQFTITSLAQLQQFRLDGLFSNNVLEHLRHPIQDLRDMMALLVSGGMMSHATACYEYRYEYTRFHLFFYTGRSRQWLWQQAGLREISYTQDGDFMCAVTAPMSE